MGIHQEKYTREYFTGVDNDGLSIGYGALQEKDDEGLWVLRSHHRIILDVIDFKDKNVLDLGCGRGEAICYAYQNGANHCVGVDFSEAAISLATELITKRNQPDAQLINLDALTFINNRVENGKKSNQLQFDIVLMLDFVEHVPRNELKDLLEGLKKIITPKTILVINSPAYKYDNDVIQYGNDDRNMEAYTDTSNVVNEANGLRCNKYTVISLQSFMSECGYLNISEAHFFVSKSLFGNHVDDIELMAYSERWRNAKDLQAPLMIEYLDDGIEVPYKVSDMPAYIKFDQGNMAGITMLLTKYYQEIAFPGGNYDAELFTTLTQQDIRNKNIFEVGAFMGVNCLLFAKLSSPDGKIFAFEPNPWHRNRIFLNLSHNLDFVNRIKVYGFALGDANDITKMTLSSEMDNGFSSTSRIDGSHPKISEKDLPPGYFSMDVDVRTLDWFVEVSNIVPDIIKIDVEGAEFALLRGGLKTLQMFHPVLFIELHSEFCTLQCSVMLQELGYKILILKEEFDNRLMIKAIPRIQSVKEAHPANYNKYLDVIGSQYEMLRQLQGFYNKELSEYHTLQSDYQDMKVKYLGLQAMDDTSKSEYQATLQELKALQIEHESLKLKSQQAQEELDELRSENDAVKSEFQSMQANYQELLGELKSLKSIYRNMEMSHQELLGEHASLKSEYQELLVKDSELKSKLYEVEIELTSLLATRSIRSIKKIKSMLVKIGLRKKY